MKPRNVVKFDHRVRGDANRFFNDVEKYINLMITDLQENCLFDSWCKVSFNQIRSEVKFMKSLMIWEDTQNIPRFDFHPEVHINVIEKMWDDIGILLFNNHLIKLDDKIAVHMMHIRRSYIKFINSCKINAEIEEED